MKRPRPWTTLALALSTALPLAAAPLPQSAEADLEARYARAWRTNDRDAFAKLREEAEKLPESARSLYLVGLMALNSVVRVNGSPDVSDPERTLEALEFANDLFIASFDLDPSQADVCVAAAFTVLHPMTIGFGTNEDPQRLRRWATRATEAEPEHASTRLLRTWLSAGGSATSPEGAADLNDRFFQLGASIVEEISAEGRPPTFWELFAEMASVRALLFSPIPRPDMGAELTAMILEQSPDYHAALRFLAPFVTERSPLPLAAFRDVPWRDARPEVENRSDEEGDGQSESLADATAVSIAGSPGDEEMWFRVDLAHAPNPDVFGVNLVFDADGSQENGSVWWGGGSDFRFDRLVSAWVVRTDDGAWRGAVGITDDAGAFEGEMTNLLDGGVRFAFDPDRKAVLLRVPTSTLGCTNEARFLVAVGSNAQWNDNLPNSGSLAASTPD